MIIDERELEKKALEFNVLDARLKELEQNLALLEKQISELQSCTFAIDEFKNSKQGKEVLVPLSPGVFVEGKLKDNKQLLVDIGAKILCKKDADEAKKIIENKINQAIEIHQRLVAEINATSQTLNQLAQEISKSQIT